MDEKMFAVMGMTCTSCSNTLFNALSCLPGVTHVVVCLLTEKVIVKGNDLKSAMVIEKIEAVGFEVRATEGRRARRCRHLQRRDKVYIQINGISEVSINVEERCIKVTHFPEAISARNIAVLIQEKLNCLVSVYQPDLSNISLLTQQKKSMHQWLKEFFLSLIFTLPIFVVSMIFHYTISSEDLRNDSAGRYLLTYNLALWIMDTPVQFIFGKRFYIGAYKSLRNGTANMDVLVALGTTAAYGFGMFMSIMYISGYQQSHGEDYILSANSFETAAMLISIILLGKYLESRSKHKSTDALRKLANLQATRAVVIIADRELDLDLTLLEVGDNVRIYPGSFIPVDGVVVSGDGSINESMMTGESALVFKTQGMSVYGGTVSNSGNMVIQVTKVGKDTAQSRIISLVESAQATKTPIQAVADKISQIFVPTIVAIAICTWAIWFYMVYNVRDMQPTPALKEMLKDAHEAKFIFAFKFGIAVLVIACPCALGLATPTAVLVATSTAAKYGILLKGGEVLEVASKIDIVVFDKTGTLTSGKPRVSDFLPLQPGDDVDFIWDMIIATEQKSEHPIGKALCEGLSPSPNVQNCEFVMIEGEGVEAQISYNGVTHDVLIGNSQLMQSKFLVPSQDMIDQCAALECQGKTVLYCAIDEVFRAVIALQDKDLVKEEAKEVVSMLLARNFEVWMLTGDSKQCASLVAEAVGIPEGNIMATCYPADKRAKVEELQGLLSTTYQSSTAESELLGVSKAYGKRKNVLFVGDGINDSPSLAQADVGIAIGATDIAMEAANIVLMKTDLRDVMSALDLSTVAFRRIKINFFWVRFTQAFIYNVLGIPLAAGAFYMTVGVRIDSVYAAAAMALSSITVIGSSLMLRRWRPPLVKRDPDVRC